MAARERAETGKPASSGEAASRGPDWNGGARARRKSEGLLSNRGGITKSLFSLTRFFLT